MVLLCLAGSGMYWLPFLSDVFYVPMKNAFAFTNTQMGVLSSAYGLTSMLAYFPGGWVADRFSPRKLITSALLIMSAGGFVFATIPSFEVSVTLFALWGLMTGLLFWSAMIKAVRNWGRRDEQGRAYGILEGGRGLTDMLAATILLWIFAISGSDYDALAESLVIQASFPLLLAIIIWFVMKDDVATREERSDPKPDFTLDGLKTVVRLPMVWLLAIIIMAAYTGYWGSVYITPYATDIYELGVVLGGAISTGKYWIAPVAAVVAGLIADRIGTAKAVVGAFIIMTIGFLIFGLIPGTPILVPMLLINAAVVACAVFALRGIYFALLEQGGIPLAVTGTTAGLASVIGYTPDIFVPPLAGMILDAYPGASGYQIFFLFVSGMSFLGLLAAYVVYRKVQAVGNSTYTMTNHDH